jgi:DNA-directed RNA polymerase subunit RPC12/RpoP
MTTANYKCPTCGGRLQETAGEADYACVSCGEPIREVVAEHQDTLTTLADSDLPCAWIAEELLPAEKKGGEP